MSESRFCRHKENVVGVGGLAGVDDEQVTMPVRGGSLEDIHIMSLC